MPRYFFHTSDGARCCDEDGTELEDVGAARQCAVRYLADLLDDDPTEFLHDHWLSVDVSDAAGLTLFNVSAITADAPAALPKS